MKLRLHPLYKNLLLLAMVLGPLYWLTLTEDGQIRTDVVLLTLFGKPELNLTIERLNSDLTEAQLRAAAQNIKAGNMNTVYIAAYSGATVYWPSKVYKDAGGSWGSSGATVRARPPPCAASSACSTRTPGRSGTAVRS